MSTCLRMVLLIITICVSSFQPWRYHMIIVMIIMTTIAFQQSSSPRCPFPSEAEPCWLPPARNPSKPGNARRTRDTPSSSVESTPRRVGSNSFLSKWCLKILLWVFLENQAQRKVQSLNGNGQPQLGSISFPSKWVCLELILGFPLKPSPSARVQSLKQMDRPFRFGLRGRSCCARISSVSWGS